MRNSEDRRGFGVPRTEQERAERHSWRFPGTPLPPRGTGIRLETGEVLSKFGNALLAGIGLAIGLVIVSSIKKKKS